MDPETLSSPSAAPHPYLSPEYVDLQVRFAERVAEVSGLTLAETLLRYTNLHRRMGLGVPGFAEPSAIWTDMLAGIAGLTHDARVARIQGTAEQLGDGAAVLLPGRIQFGCFACEPPDGHGMIRIHFGNRTENAEVGPLHSSRIAERRKELTTMFGWLAREYPNARRVDGGSWLYNIEAYRRLFPPDFAASRDPRNGPEYLHGMSSWGLLENAVRPDTSAAASLVLVGGSHTADYPNSLEGRILASHHLLISRCYEWARGGSDDQWDEAMSMYAASLETEGSNSLVVDQLMNFRKRLEEWDLGAIVRNQQRIEDLATSWRTDTDLKYNALVTELKRPSQREDSPQSNGSIEEIETQIELFAVSNANRISSLESRVEYLTTRLTDLLLEHGSDAHDDPIPPPSSSTVTSVFFSTSSSILTAEARVFVRDVAKRILTEHPDAEVSVAGFADERGDASFNAELAQKRAKEVGAELAAAGVRAISIVSSGETISFGDEWADNRRVVIQVSHAPTGQLPS